MTFVSRLTGAGNAAPRQWLAELENASVPEPFTNEQLGFECDEQLRGLISSFSYNESTNALLIQIARQNQRILDALKKHAAAAPATTSTPVAP